MARWKARVELVLSLNEHLFLSLAVEALQAKMCRNSLPSGGGRSLGAKISGESGRPPANILIPGERQLLALQLFRWQWNFAADFSSFIVEIVRKTTNLRIWSPFWGSQERRRTLLMSLWKGPVDFLLTVIVLLFLSLAVEALHGKMCQNSLPSWGVGHLEPRFQGEGVVSLPMYWYHSKGIWLRYNLAADFFYIINVKKLNSLKHRVRSQITRLKLQKSFCDLEHGVLLWI